MKLSLKRFEKAMAESNNEENLALFRRAREVPNGIVRMTEDKQG